MFCLVVCSQCLSGGLFNKYNKNESLPTAGWLLLVCVFRIKTWFTKSTPPIIKGVSNFHVCRIIYYSYLGYTLLKDFRRKGKALQGLF